MLVLKNKKYEEDNTNDLIINKWNQPDTHNV